MGKDACGSSLTLGTRLVLTFMGATLCLALACVGGYVWSREGWFNFAGPIWPDPWYGYTAGGFFGLLALVFLAPLAFTLYFVVAQHALRRAGNSSSLCSYVTVNTVVLSALAGLAVGGWYYARFILNCGFGFLCVHEENHFVPPGPDGVPLAGEAWWATLGAKMFFPALLFLATTLMGLVSHVVYRRHYHRIAADAAADAQDMPLLQSPSSLLEAQQYGITNGSNNSSGKGSNKGGNKNRSRAARSDADMDDVYHRLGAGKLSADGDGESDGNKYASPADAARAMSRTADNTAIGAGRNTPSARECPGLGLWVLLLACLAALGVLFWLSTYFPNNWENYAPFRLAQAANETMTQDPELCGNWPYNSCPELPRAVFTTVNAEMARYWNLKFYPSNVIFYLFLASVPVLAMLFRATATTDALMSRKIRVRRCSLREALTFQWGTSAVATQPARLAFFTLREIGAVLATATAAALFFFYWVHDHNYGNRWPGGQVSSIEAWCRSLGQLATFFLALLMFPAARNSPVLALLGVSWEAAIQYHRWLGVAFLGASLAHMGTAWGWFGDLGGFPADVFQLPQTHAHSKDNFTVPLMQWVMWIVIITIGVFSLREKIRRTSFELFLYAHHITYCLLIPAVLWHAQASWEYLFPGLIIWIVDRAVRAFRSARALRLLPLPVPANATPASIAANNTGNNANAAVAEAGGVAAAPQTVLGAVAADYGAAGPMVELRVSGDAFNYKPGQYAFINVAEVSLFEWHPFTIASPVHGTARNEIAFHIKAMGAKTWTDALYRYVEDRQLRAGLNLPLTLSVDGPYGTPIDFKAYANVILVAGGIGVTPCKSIFESLHHSYLASRAAEQQSGDSSSLVGSGSAAAAYGYGQAVSGGAANGSAPLARRVHLLFAARDAALFDIMGDSLTALPQGPFSAQLFLDVPPEAAGAGAVAAAQRGLLNSSVAPGAVATAAAANGSANGAGASTPFAAAAAARVASQFGHLLVRGRPNFSETLTAIARRSDVLVDPAYASDPTLNTGYGSGYTDAVHAKKNKTLVFVCGPPGITAACEALAHEQGWDFHTETFAL